MIASVDQTLELEQQLLQIIVEHEDQEDDTPISLDANFIPMFDGMMGDSASHVRIFDKRRTFYRENQGEMKVTYPSLPSGVKVGDLIIYDRENRYAHRVVVSDLQQLPVIMLAPNDSALVNEFYFAIPLSATRLIRDPIRFYYEQQNVELLLGLLMHTEFHPELRTLRSSISDGLYFVRINRCSGNFESLIFPLLEIEEIITINILDRCEDYFDESADIREHNRPSRINVTKVIPSWPQSIDSNGSASCFQN